MISVASSAGCRQLLSGPGKSANKPSPFNANVKYLQLPQSASKPGHLILINRLSSDGSSIKNESESQNTNTLNPYLESDRNGNSNSNPRRLNMERQQSNCSPFAVQIISDGLEDDNQINTPNSHRDLHRNSDM